jgi:hypothetical protein
MALLTMKVSTELLTTLFLLPADKPIISASTGDDGRHIVFVVADNAAPDDVEEIQPVYHRAEHVVRDDIGYIKTTVVGFASGKEIKAS